MTKAEMKSVVLIASSKLLASVSASGVHANAFHAGNNGLVKRAKDFHGINTLKPTLYDKDPSAYELAECLLLLSQVPVVVWGGRQRI
jgi:hypothetical protein